MGDAHTILFPLIPGLLSSSLGNADPFQLSLQRSRPVGFCHFPHGRVRGAEHWAKHQTRFLLALLPWGSRPTVWSSLSAVSVRDHPVPA